MRRTSRSVGCCGVTEIYNLDDFYGTHYGSRGEADTIPFVLTSHRAGIAIATTVPEQKESIRHLKEHGFHAVLETPNPKTSTLITLWVRDLSEGKLPVKIARKPWIMSRIWHFCGYLRRCVMPMNDIGRGPYVNNNVLDDE